MNECAPLSNKYSMQAFTYVMTTDNNSVQFGRADKYSVFGQ